MLELSRPEAVPASEFRPGKKQASLSGYRWFESISLLRGVSNEPVPAVALPMAFQASIFTEDLRTAFDAAERLAASAVIVHDHTAFRTDWMPFAGRRQSGYGIGGIPWTMREMTEQKMIVLRV